jgi:hypothetical protein
MKGFSFMFVVTINYSANNGVVCDARFIIAVSTEISYCPTRACGGLAILCVQKC